MSRHRRIEDLSAREVMSAPAIACREDAFFEEVAELLADREISGVPVVDDDGRVIGVISERDLAHALGGRLIRLAMRHPVRSGPWLRRPQRVPLDRGRARDIMTAPPIVASSDTPLHALAMTLVTEQINRLPIVEEGRLVGVITRADVLGAIAGLSHRAVELREEPVAIGAGVFPDAVEGDRR